MTGDRRQVTALVLTADPRAPHWGLHPTRDECSRALLGWTETDLPVDDGPPDLVIDLVSEAICRSGSVTFFHKLPEGISRDAAKGWTTVEGGSVRALRPPPLERLKGATTIPLWWTSDPVIARRLFSSEGFWWEQRGQLVFLAANEVAPPALAYELVKEVFDGERPLDLGALADLGSGAVMFPGIDGDFVELVACDETFWRRLLASLEAESARRGVEWRVVDESQFAKEISPGSRSR